MPVETRPSGRNRQQRSASEPPQALPRLHRPEHELLIDWARSSALRRSVETLNQLAGPARLELVDRLAAALLDTGWAALDEVFRAGRWWLQALHWRELAALQQALGLRTEADREQTRSVQSQALAELARGDWPELQAAAAATRSARLSAAVRGARLELLQALQSWRDMQRRGMRRDFALHARPHTKAISSDEWDWLEAYFDLDACGIERLADILWLAGDVQLQFGVATLDLAAVPFVGLPHDSLAALTAIRGVQRHWLIENRTPFERQARQREAGVLIAWLPGRPSDSWCDAWERLLRHAPAPVDVSADADPVGIEIALTAGAVCARAGCLWQPFAMEPQRLDDERPLPLNDYDEQTLARLCARTDLPPQLAALATAIAQRRCKHEQEAWL